MHCGNEPCEQHRGKISKSGLKSAGEQLACSDIGRTGHPVMVANETRPDFRLELCGYVEIDFEEEGFEYEIRRSGPQLELGLRF
jgi:hypothetical protein